jgi:hypothetical protein
MLEQLDRVTRLAQWDTPVRTSIERFRILDRHGRQQVSLGAENHSPANEVY